MKRKDAKLEQRVTIRHARVEDRAAIEQCFVELQTFERSIEPNRAPPGEIASCYVEALFADGATHQGAILLAEADGRVVGFASIQGLVRSDDILEAKRDHAYITDLVVLPAHRRQGVGRSLMEAAEAHAIACGATQVRVGVLAANAAARHLYENLGYREYEMVLEKQLRCGACVAFRRQAAGRRNVPLPLDKP